MAPLRTAWVSGPVLPDGLVAAQQKAAHQVGGRQVLVAGDGDQGVRKVPGRGFDGLEEPPGHVLDEARLAASGWPLEEHREAASIGRLEDRDLVRERQVVRGAHPG